MRVPGLFFCIKWGSRGPEGAREGRRIKVRRSPDLHTFNSSQVGATAPAQARPGQKLPRLDSGTFGPELSGASTGTIRAFHPFTQSVRSVAPGQLRRPSSKSVLGRP